MVSFLLTPLVAWLERLHLSRITAVLLVIVLSLALFGLLAWVVTGQLMQITAQLPDYETNIHRKIQWIEGPKDGRLSKASDTIKRLNRDLSTPEPEAPAATRRSTRRELAKEAESRPIPVQVAKPPSSALEFLRGVLGPLMSPLKTVGLVIVFTLFMLMKREDLRNRGIRLAGQGRLSVVTQALVDATGRLSRYLVLQFVVHVTYGSLFGLGLYLIGIPHALLWGFLAVILRFVPYLGTLAAAACPVVMAFAVFPGWTQAMLAFGLFCALELAVSNVVEPLLYGSHTGISPFAILVAAVFWATLWGPIGLIVSTPLTVCLMVLGRYIPQLEFLEILLGDEPVLSLHAQFYQRLLAMDSDEASEIAEAHLKEKGPQSLYEAVFIPALSLAEQDRHLHGVDEGRLNFIRQTTRELIEDLGERVNEKEPSDTSSNVDNSHETRPVSAGALATALGNIVCVPARDETDELIAIMLVQLLQRSGHSAQALPIGTVADMLEQVAQQDPQLVCVSALPPFVVGHARSLSRQLRMRFPHTKILVGLWGLDDRVPRAQERMRTTSADAVATTLDEALVQIRHLVSIRVPDTRVT